MWLTIAAGLLMVVSLGLVIWQWEEARRFPLHQRVAPATAPLGVTLLKPLKGCDHHTQACLRSWLQQDFPGPVQVLFGVASEQDPVCELVQALALEHPGLDLQLVICPDRHGSNAKVSTLMHLEPSIAHELVLISDADVLVPPDLFTQIVALYQHQQPALIHCFYALCHPANTAMHLEALAVNADFWPQVLQARRLAELDFALGAAMLTTQTWLKNTGGFRPIANYLADDFQLGQRITRAGGRIVLCPVVVECRTATQSWLDVWQHQLRWARTVRVCRPLPYFFSILNNATGWALLFLSVGTALPFLARLLSAALVLAVRVGTARDAEARLTGPLGRVRSTWWMPLGKDLLQVVLWALAFLGSEIRWRGEPFHVKRGGCLEAAPRGTTCRTRQLADR